MIDPLSSVPTGVNWSVNRAIAAGSRKTNIVDCFLCLTTDYRCIVHAIVIERDSSINEV